MENDLKLAVVCSSNQNRSMEAHNCLWKKGFKVRSFGTGNQVKLPGPTSDKPNVYDFSVTYDEMYKDLMKRDRDLYTQNGILHMLDRNRRIKPHPEKYQNNSDRFDVIFTCEERVFDQVVEDHMEKREKFEDQSVHIINIDIQDNHEDATLGAFIILEICSLLAACDDIDNDIDDILLDFEGKTHRPILHTVIFY